MLCLGGDVRHSPPALVVQSAVLVAYGRDVCRHVAELVAGRWEEVRESTPGKTRSNLWREASSSADRRDANREKCTHQTTALLRVEIMVNTQWAPAGRSGQKRRAGSIRSGTTHTPFNLIISSPVGRVHSVD
jgi:hypothetical protein